MTKKLFLTITIAAISATIIGVGAFLFFKAPGAKQKTGLPMRDSVVAKASGTELGLGWSVVDNPKAAAREALLMALAGKNCKTPDFAIIFSGLKNDTQAVLKEARRLLGKNTKIYGGAASSKGLIDVKTECVTANKGNFKSGYLSGDNAIKGEAKGVVAITVTSKSIVFGVGSTDLSAFSSLQEAVKQAALKARQNAGANLRGLPKLVLFTSSVGGEEELIKGVEKVVGKSVLICGNSPVTSKFSVFAENKTIKKGVSLAVIYTNLPIGCNLIQMIYRKIHKPEAIRNLLLVLNRSEGIGRKLI